MQAYGRYFSGTFNRPGRFSLLVIEDVLFGKPLTKDGASAWVVKEGGGIAAKSWF